MKAILRRSAKAGDAALVDVPEPTAGPGQLKLKVAYAGICSSDAHLLPVELPSTPRFQPPVVIGHEGVGHVVEIGAGVTGYQVGDLVASETTFTCCGVCEQCRRGEPGMCRSGRKSLGWSANGYWAEYILVNAQFSHKLAPHVSAKGAAVLEPFICGVKAVLQRVKVNPGDWAVVWGPGPIGLGLAQMAKLAGARVIVVGTEHSRPRLEVAKKIGAFRTLVSGVDDIVAEVRAMTGGYGAQLCCDATGSPATFMQAITCARRQGNVLMLSASFDKPVVFDPHVALEQAVGIVFAEGTNPYSWDVAVNLLNAGLVDLDSLVSDVFPLDQWQAGAAKTRAHEGMKILLQP
jgi:L-iditol 2-dehydrogenase